MRKTTKNLLICSLVLVFALSFSITLAKAQNVNQAKENENQVKINENQAKINENQAKINENQGKINENQGNASQFNGAAHRSAVASFVQNLLNVADKEQGGIGQEVKAIAQAQNDNLDKEVAEIDKINNRSKTKTFLIGTDYKNIGMLRSNMVKTQNQIDQLNRLLDKTTSTETKAELQAQILVLTPEQQKIDDFIKANESKFSLLGWLVKIFQ